MTQINEIMQALFQNAGQRERAVVERRFGLLKGEPETLEAIGRGYSITRERVRQIETAALAAMREPATKSKGYQELVRGIREALTTHKVMPGENLLAEMKKRVSGLTENHLAFLERFSRAFKICEDDKKFRRFYYVNDDAKKSAMKFIADWVKTMHKEKERILHGEYKAVFSEFLRSAKAPADIAAHYLSISKEIFTNVRGEIGHRDWAEVNPRTIRDRIYYVLKKHQKPLHFNDIAKRITEAGFGTKAALASTVHNELIKDERFVLVGRGMYGLKESGYLPGTAKQVIQRLLKKHGPLSHQEIVTFVGKERILKPNTILVNLQDKSSFMRTNDGRYTIRES